jgi:hypothetical protein
MSRNAKKTSLNDSLQKRLDILIKLNRGRKRRQLLRLKSRNQLDVESNRWIVDCVDEDLTLYLMETCVQVPSTKITDALRGEAPTVFPRVTDWTIVDDALRELSHTVSLATIRDCINGWIFKVRRANRRPDDTSADLLFKFPSECRALQTIVEWLDDLCE